MITTINTNPHTEVDNENVVCPYCEATYQGSSEWVKDYAEEMTCEECGSIFNYWAEYSVDYVTTPVRSATVVVVVEEPVEVVVVEDVVDVVEGF
jgi:transposase-like protein